MSSFPFCFDVRQFVQFALGQRVSQAVGDEVPAVLAAVMNAHLAGFSKTEWQTLKSYLQRMLATGDKLRETQ